MFDVVCTTVNGGIPIFYRKHSKIESVSGIKHDKYHNINYIGIGLISVLQCVISILYILSLFSLCTFC